MTSRSPQSRPCRSLQRTTAFRRLVSSVGCRERMAQSRPSCSTCGYQRPLLLPLYFFRAGTLRLRGTRVIVDAVCTGNSRRDAQLERLHGLEVYCRLVDFKRPERTDVGSERVVGIRLLVHLRSVLRDRDSIGQRFQNRRFNKSFHGAICFFRLFQLASTPTRDDAPPDTSES